MLSYLNDTNTTHSNWSQNQVHMTEAERFVYASSRKHSGGLFLKLRSVDGTRGWLGTSPRPRNADHYSCLVRNQRQSVLKLETSMSDTTPPLPRYGTEQLITAFCCLVLFLLASVSQLQSMPCNISPPSWSSACVCVYACLRRSDVLRFVLSQWFLRISFLGQRSKDFGVSDASLNDMPEGRMHIKCHWNSALVFKMLGFEL